MLDYTLYLVWKLEWKSYNDNDMINVIRVLIRLSEPNDVHELLLFHMRSLGRATVKYAVSL